MIKNIIDLVEVCNTCLKPLPQRKSDEPHKCVNCKRIYEKCSQLRNIFAYPQVSQTSFNLAANIRANGAFKIATCPICGAVAQVRGCLNPIVICRICKTTLQQFNGKVIAHDTLLDLDLPYLSNTWKPVFDEESMPQNKNSNLLDKLKELNL